MKMTTIKTDTYHIKDSFFVDIVSDDTTYQAWIYNEQYCIKQMMFGVSLFDNTYEEFLDLVITNIAEYITSYVDDVFDFEERGKFYAENNNLQSK